MAFAEDRQESPRLDVELPAGKLGNCEQHPWSVRRKIISTTTSLEKPMLLLNDVADSFVGSINPTARNVGSRTLI